MIGSHMAIKLQIQRPWLILMILQLMPAIALKEMLAIKII